MSEATYTPGPWRISQNVSRHIIAPKGGVVACAELTWDGPGSSSTADANARLIAAAPALLEALKLLIEEVQWNREGPIQDGLLICVNKAVAAISKATEAA